MYILVTMPVRLIGQSENPVPLTYSWIPFLTCVFWALIQLNLAVNLWNGFALERSQRLAEGRHLAISPWVSCAYFWEATANGEITLLWKLPGNTPKSSYVVAPASSTAAWVLGLLGQLRALCMWLFWQERGVWKARKMEARTNSWGKKARSEEKCLKTWETLSRFKGDGQLIFLVCVLRISTSWVDFPVGEIVHETSWRKSFMKQISLEEVVFFSAPIFSPFVQQFLSLWGRFFSPPLSPGPDLSLVLSRACWMSPLCCPF